MITVQELKSSLPANLRSSATQSLADKINNLASDPIVAKEIADNFISYVGVMREGRFRMEDYTNAVQYVTYKLMGKSNKDAYAATFPERMINMQANGYDDKTISSYVAAFNKNKLVNLIMEQTLIPMWVLNADKYQQAINVQADLMVNAKSEMVRTTAANSLLSALEKPKEAANLNLNINTSNENSSINALAEAINQLTDKQTELIKSGVTAKEIAAQKIIEGEYEDVQ